MQSIYDELQAAMDAELTAKVIDLLVDIAEHLIERPDRERAVEILAFALMYPMRAVTFDRADAMYRDMESVLCPRVIADAHTLAQELTLEDLVKLIRAEYAD